MKGADEYAKLFETGQRGRLYIVSYSHARGPCFHIFVLPDGEKAIPNGTSNAPLNKNGVEVYGITGGHPGWTETYGWLHHGKWVDDFDTLVGEAKKREAEKLEQQELARIAKDEATREKTRKLLDLY